MRDRQVCIGCGKKSPETETNYTLISAQFGWRLTRYRDEKGTIVIEWRCPACWREYKKAKDAKEGVAPSYEPPTNPRVPAAQSSGQSSAPASMPAPGRRSTPPPAPKTGRR